MSLWLLLGAKTFMECLVLDVVFLAATILLAAFLLFVFWRYREWIALAKNELVVFLLGKDRIARIIPVKTLGGQFLDLGPYGTFYADPHAIYKTKTKTKTHIAFAYAPYGVILRAEYVAGVQKLKEKGYQTIGDITVSDPEGNVAFKNETVEIDKVEPLKIQDIVGWMPYTIGPQALDEAITLKLNILRKEQGFGLDVKKLALIVFVVIAVLVLLSVFGVV